MAEGYFNQSIQLYSRRTYKPLEPPYVLKLSGLKFFFEKWLLEKEFLDLVKLKQNKEEKPYFFRRSTRHLDHH